MDWGFWCKNRSVFETQSAPSGLSNLTLCSTLPGCLNLRRRAGTQIVSPGNRPFFCMMLLRRTPILGFLASGYGTVTCSGPSDNRSYAVTSVMQNIGSLFWRIDLGPRSPSTAPVALRQFHSAFSACRGHCNCKRSRLSSSHSRLFSSLFLAMC